MYGTFQLKTYFKIIYEKEIIIVFIEAILKSYFKKISIIKENKNKKPLAIKVRVFLFQ
jgi:hypothetical protein